MQFKFYSLLVINYFQKHFSYYFLVRSIAIFLLLLLAILYCLLSVIRMHIHIIHIFQCVFFLVGIRSMYTRKQYVNLMRGNNFQILQFHLNNLQSYCGYLCNLLSLMHSLLTTNVFIIKLSMRIVCLLKNAHFFSIRHAAEITCNKLYLFG